MLVYLDKLVERYAKLVVSIADFLGINEKQLVYGWIVVSTLILAIPLGKTAVLLNTAFILLLELPYMLWRAKQDFLLRDYFRQFDGMADGYIVSDIVRRLRVLVFLLVAALSFRYYGTGFHQFWVLLAILKFIFPMYLWNYMIKRGSGGKKVRLKDMVEAGIKKLRARLTPQTPPSPVPQPA